jgi:hypothetical protein
MMRHVSDVLLETHGARSLKSAISFGSKDKQDILQSQ